MYGAGVIKGLWVTLKHLFGKKLTVQYPEEMPVLQKRFRGHLQFDIEKCIACGLCISSCPNNVLSLEDARDEQTKKKKVLSYTIDHQYCMFCNFCVEVCPTKCLYFNHDFELAQYKRDQIKVVYHRPAHLDQVAQGAESSQGASHEADEAAEKKAKQINAMINAVKKNPVKVLSKFVEDEKSAEILAEILLADEAKLQKLAPMMVEDKEKAEKIAKAYVAKELKDREKGGSEQ